MSSADAERLRAIKTFPSLVKYLRDELDWPIESTNFDDLTFDYQPEELGLDAATAVKIKEIKQLRPLGASQPWGMFFINFEPKQLPVVVLRRILRSLVIKKRKSAAKSHQATWQLHDLLFISSYGESEHRDITFAHFSEDLDTGDLPALRVLGWDDEDTVAHLEHAHKTLKDNLRWPANTFDAKAWRATWSQAFVFRNREVIATAKGLAVRMAELATAIRKRVNKVLAIESEKGPLRKIQAAFKEALIHDLTEDDFADMYAQTITYGMLSARVSRPTGLIAENIADMVPVTNPFLRDLLSTFLTVGGRKGKIDFDELGINEVVQALRDANMEAVLRDFGDKNPQEDPVIHFYELFLKEYDPKKRMQRGVFYTPRPVVSYIVHSVHELLHDKFGLVDGLADTTTWGEMAKRQSDLKIPKGVKSDDPFVQILDPATGTGTFLVEVIDIIHKTMNAKWKEQGKASKAIDQLWNQYVAEHLLPRLYGFELMMAPYAIAHMKIGLKLHDTGYHFASHERARIYLTNSLEKAQDFSDRFEFDAPALAHEANAVNAVKEHKRFTIVIGNPPYSIISVNINDWISDLCARFKVNVRLRERQIQALSDDYVKFLRLMHWQIERSDVGIVGVITNNGYLDGHLFEDVRTAISDTFHRIWILNLHGNLRTQERTPEGELDKNVFDIQTGVAIVCLLRVPKANSSREVRASDLWGSRKSKYAALLSRSHRQAPWTSIEMLRPSDRWVPTSKDLLSEWEAMHGLLDVFGTGQPDVDAQRRYAAGFVSQQDDFAIAFSEEELRERVMILLREGMTEDVLRQKFRLCTTTQWNFDRAREELRMEHVDDLLTTCTYRPFDTRWTLFHRGVVSILRKELMRHLFRKANIALLATRGISRQMFAHIFVAKYLVDRHALDNASESMFVLPLYIYPSSSIEGSVRGLFANDEREANLSSAFKMRLAQLHDEATSVRPEEVLGYAYALWHSPGFRQRYAEFLKTQFPRLPLTSSRELFYAMARLGGELVALHLMESSRLDQHVARFIGTGGAKIEKLSYTEETVWIDKQQTEGFRGVPENVWNFFIGGYQVCEKWLKDRKGRKLTKGDIDHYQKIVVALNETIRLMKEIDEVIERHGGWPGAFSSYVPETKDVPMAAEAQSKYPQPT